MPWRAIAPATLLALAFFGFASGNAHAQRIENGKAVFAALDKVTARISRLEVKLGESVRFGALQITPRACYSRPPTEPPKTTTFVEIDELLLDGKSQRIFTGWMFAESPGLSAAEHPVYDIWLTECADPLRATVAERPAATSDGKGEPEPEAAPQRRARPRR